MISVPFRCPPSSASGDLESLVGNTGKAAEFRCHECYKGILQRIITKGYYKGITSKGLLPFDKIFIYSCICGRDIVDTRLWSTKPRMCRVLAIPGDRRSHALHEYSLFEIWSCRRCTRTNKPKGTEAQSTVYRVGSSKNVTTFKYLQNCFGPLGLCRIACDG